QKQGVQPVSVFEMKDFVVGIEAEVNRRLGMLCLLYNRRRSDPDRAGISMFDLEVIEILQGGNRPLQPCGGSPRVLDVPSFFFRCQLSNAHVQSNRER